jgi:hypothetical protein
MTRDELKRRLDAAGIFEDVYRLDGQPPAYEGWVLGRTLLGRWKVDYYERGKPRRLGTFRSEQEACEFLEGLLMRDPTIRAQRKE